MTTDWRRRLYGAYVSSGQARVHEGDVSGAVDKKRPALRRMIRSFFPSDSAAEVVDLACGIGAALLVSKEHGYSNVRGVDGSPEMVAAAHNLGFTDVVEGDVAHYLSRLPDSSVDVVLALDILEHFERQALFDMLGDVLRVLKSGGRLIAHLPNAQGIFGGSIRYGDLTHELSFTPSSLNQVLTALGFTEITCHEERPIPRGPVSAARAVLWTVGSFFPRVLFAAETGDLHPVLSMNMTCVAKKPLG